MRRYLVLGFVAAIAVSMAACATQPVMSSDYVSALRSGKIIVMTPPGPMFYINARLNKSGLAGLIIAENGDKPLYVFDNGSSAAASDILKPYKNQMKELPIVEEFMASIRKASQQVIWMHGSSIVAQNDESLDVGQMRHITQKGHVDAVAFVRPIVLFAHSLRRIYLFVTVSVYARGSKNPFFLSGGQLVVPVELKDTRPDLSSYGVEAIAVDNNDNQVTRHARAEVWFESDAARLKQAIAKGMIVLQQDLSNFFDGRRIAH